MENYQKNQDILKDLIKKLAHTIQDYNSRIRDKESVLSRTFFSVVIDNEVSFKEHTKFTQVNHLSKNNLAFDYIKNYEISNKTNILNDLKFELFKDLSVFVTHIEPAFSLDQKQFNSMQHSIGITNHDILEAEDEDTRLTNILNINIYLKKTLDDISNDELNVLDKLVFNILI